MKHASSLHLDAYIKENTSLTSTVAINTVGQLNPIRDDTPNTRHIAEIIVPQFSERDTLLLPMISAFTQQSSERWTTWITSRQPSKALLKSMKVDLSCLRIVHMDSSTDSRWVIWQALAQGNSHTVIAEQATYSSSDISAMEDAAARGDCKGILVRSWD